MWEGAPKYTPMAHPIHAVVREKAARPDTGGHEGVNGGMVAFLCFLTFGLGMGAVLGMQRYRARTLRQLGSFRAQTAPLGRLPPSISTTSMAQPLASSAAPIGAYAAPSSVPAQPYAPNEDHRPPDLTAPGTA